MAHAHFVKKARKDNPAVKAGESYWWWEFKFGGKHYSATQPRPSQLTQSEFYSQYYSIQETLEDALGRATHISEVAEAIEDAKSELESLRDETQDKLDNMPEQLQDADSGQLLQERIDGCEEYISSLESIEIPEEPEEEEKVERNLELVQRTEDSKWAVQDNDTGKVISDWFDDHAVAEEAMEDELADDDQPEGETEDDIVQNLKDEVLNCDPGI